MQVAPRPDTSFKDTFDALNQARAHAASKKRAVHLSLVCLFAEGHLRSKTCRASANVARQGDGPLDRRLVAPHPVHPTSSLRT